MLFTVKDFDLTPHQSAQLASTLSNKGVETQGTKVMYVKCFWKGKQIEQHKTLNLYNAEDAIKRLENYKGKRKFIFDVIEKLKDMHNKKGVENDLL